MAMIPGGIKIGKDHGCFHIFFDENMYHPNLAELQDISLANYLRGWCVGTRLDTVPFGHIAVLYNPARTDDLTAFQAVEALVAAITATDL